LRVAGGRLKVGGIHSHSLYNSKKIIPETERE
jgi:hypothetical protein